MHEKFHLNNSLSCNIALHIFSLGQLFMLLSKNNKKNHHIFTLIIVVLVFWLIYTVVMLFNFAEAVSTDMSGDINAFIEGNENVAHQIENELTPSMVKKSPDILLLDNYQGKRGLNIREGHYSIFSGTLLMLGDEKAFDYDISTFLHSLDKIWAGLDSTLPNAFFIGYSAQDRYIYRQLRTNTIPDLKIIHDPQFHIDLDARKNSTLIIPNNDNRNANQNIITIVTPIYKGDQLWGDVGMQFDINQLMTDSMGEWLSHYIAIDISYGNQHFSSITDRSELFFPNYFHHTLKLRGINISTYMKTNYFMLSVLPWLICVSLLMLLIYWVLSLHRKIALKSVRISISDELTGLFNKRALHQLTESNSLSGVIFYIDVNKFKAINDTYGHSVGDEALIYIAQGIKTCASKSDFCFRIGGDEFLLISSNSIEPEKFIQKLKLEIEGKTFSETSPSTLTVSVGYSLIDNPDSITEAIHQADLAMYEDKINRR